MQFWAPQKIADLRIFECDQRKVTKLVKGLEDMSYRGGWRHLGYLVWRKGGWERKWRERGADLFSLVSNDWTWGNGTKLSQGRFWLDIRKKLFIMKVVKHWDRVLERWLMPHSYRNLKSIWIIPSLIYFNFWLALKWLGSWPQPLCRYHSVQVQLIAESYLLTTARILPNTR